MSIEIEVKANSQQARADLQRLNKSVDNIAKSTNNFSRQISTSFKAISIGATALLGAGGLKGVVDSYTRINNRIKLTTKSVQEQISIQRRLLVLSRQSKSELESTVALYSSLVNNAGVANKKALVLTKTLQQAAKISGGSAAAIDGAMLQIQQAFAAGVLRGQELNSVLANMPRLTQAIAKEMNVLPGQLKKLGAEGKITGKILEKALLNNAKAIDKEFQGLAITVGQSFREASKEVKDGVNSILKVLDTGALGPAIQKVGRAIGDALRSAAISLRIFQNDLLLFRLSIEDNFNSLRGIPTAVFEKLFAGMLTFTNKLKTVSRRINTFIIDVKSMFFGLYKYVIGNSVYKDMINEIVRYTPRVNKAVAFIRRFIISVKSNFFNLYMYVVGNSVYKDMINEIISFSGNLKMAIPAIASFINSSALLIGKFSVGVINTLRSLAKSWAISLGDSAIAGLDESLSKGNKITNSIKKLLGKQVIKSATSEGIAEIDKAFNGLQRSFIVNLAAIRNSIIAGLSGAILFLSTSFQGLTFNLDFLQVATDRFTTKLAGTKSGFNDFKKFALEASNTVVEAWTKDMGFLEKSAQAFLNVAKPKIAEDVLGGFRDLTQSVAADIEHLIDLAKQLPVFAVDELVPKAAFIVERFTASLVDFIASALGQAGIILSASALVLGKGIGVKIASGIALALSSLAAGFAANFQPENAKEEEGLQGILAQLEQQTSVLNTMKDGISALTSNTFSIFSEGNRILSFISENITELLLTGFFAKDLIKGIGKGIGSLFLPGAGGAGISRLAGARGVLGGSTTGALEDQLKTVENRLQARNEASEQAINNLRRDISDEEVFLKKRKDIRAKFDKDNREIRNERKALTLRLARTRGSFDEANKIINESTARVSSAFANFGGTIGGIFGSFAGFAGAAKLGEALGLSSAQQFVATVILAKLGEVIGASFLAFTLGRLSTVFAGIFAGKGVIGGLRMALTGSIGAAFKKSGGIISKAFSKGGTSFATRISKLGPNIARFFSGGILSVVGRTIALLTTTLISAIGGIATTFPVLIGGAIIAAAAYFWNNPGLIQEAGKQIGVALYNAQVSITEDVLKAYAIIKEEFNKAKESAKDFNFKRDVIDTFPKTGEEWARFAIETLKTGWDIAEALEPFITSFTEKMEPFITAITNFATNLKKYHGLASSIAEGFVKRSVEIGIEMAMSFADTLKQRWDEFSIAFDVPALWEKFLNSDFWGGQRNQEQKGLARPAAMATGGSVRGPGTGTSDDIPAMLSNGEFVVKASSVDGNVRALEHLNETGKLPGFATGGLADGLQTAAELNTGLNALALMASALQGRSASSTIAKSLRMSEEQLLENLPQDSYWTRALTTPIEDPNKWAESITERTGARNIDGVAQYLKVKMASAGASAVYSGDVNKSQFQSMLQEIEAATGIRIPVWNGISDAPQFLYDSSMLLGSAIGYSGRKANEAFRPTLFGFSQGWGDYHHADQTGSENMFNRSVYEGLKFAPEGALYGGLAGLGFGLGSGAMALGRGVGAVGGAIGRGSKRAYNAAFNKKGTPTPSKGGDLSQVKDVAKWIGMSLATMSPWGLAAKTAVGSLVGGAAFTADNALRYLIEGGEAFPGFSSRSTASAVADKLKNPDEVQKFSKGGFVINETSSAWDLIKKEEGFKPHAYLDSLNYPTIGYGRLLERTAMSQTELDNHPVYSQIHKGKDKETIESEEAKNSLDLLQNTYLPTAIDFMGGRDVWQQIDQTALDPVISMAYNLGATKLADFTGFREGLLNSDFNMAAYQLMDSGAATQAYGRYTGLIKRYLGLGGDTGSLADAKSKRWTDLSKMWYRQHQVRGKYDSMKNEDGTYQNTYTEHPDTLRTVDTENKTKWELGYKELPGFATGGSVFGSGTATSDSIPAMLSNGEFVVKASSVDGNRGLLEHLNNTGKLPGFSTGGSVDGGDVNFLDAIAASITAFFKQLLSEEAFEGLSGFTQQLKEGISDLFSGATGRGDAQKLEIQNLEQLAERIAPLFENVNTETLLKEFESNSRVAQQSLGLLGSIERLNNRAANGDNSLDLKLSIDSTRNDLANLLGLSIGIQEKTEKNTFITARARDRAATQTSNITGKASEGFSSFLKGEQSFSDFGQNLMNSLNDSVIDGFSASLMEGLFAEDKLLGGLVNDRFEKSNALGEGIGSASPGAVDSTGFMGKAVKGVKSLFGFGGGEEEEEGSGVLDSAAVPVRIVGSEKEEGALGAGLDSLLPPDTDTSDALEEGGENLGGGVEEGSAKGAATFGGIFDKFTSGFGGMMEGMTTKIGQLFGGGGGGGAGGVLGGVLSIASMFFHSGGIVPDGGGYSKLNGGEMVLTEAQQIAMFNGQNNHPKEQSVQNISVNVTGDISRQTKKEIYGMLPSIATGVNQYNRENR